MENIIEKLQQHSESKHPLLYLFRQILESKWTVIEELTKRRSELERSMEDRKAEIDGIERTVAKMKEKIVQEQEKISTAEYQAQRHSVTASEYKAEAFQMKAYGVENELTEQQADKEQAYVEKMTAAVKRSRLNIMDLNKAIGIHEEKSRSIAENLESEKSQYDSLVGEMEENQADFQFWADKAEETLKQTEAAERLKENKDVSVVDYPVAWIQNNIDVPKPFAWQDDGLDCASIRKFVDDELAKFRSGGKMLEFVSEEWQNEGKEIEPFEFNCKFRLKMKREDIASIAENTLNDGEAILEKEYMNASRWRRFVCGKVFPERCYKALCKKDDKAFAKDYAPEQLVENLASLGIQKPAPEVLPVEEYPSVIAASPLGLEAFVQAPAPRGEWFDKRVKLGLATGGAVVALILALICVLL